MLSTYRMAKFGQGGTVLRARGTEPLELQEIATRIPSVFAEQKHASRSEKYSFIPTYQLLESMVKEGFLPMEVRQGGSKDEEKRGFTKHLIRFRQQGTVPVVGDTFPEVVLVNSHDGTSSYQLMSGWFRLVCSNGMVVSENAGPSLKISHRGNVSDVIDASFTVVSSFAEQAQSIEAMATLQLTGPEQELFAASAATLRFDEEQHVQPAQLLRLHRNEDRGNDLWRTFNRVQENIIDGGVKTQHVNERGQTSRRRSRSVNGIGENVKLNQALWQLAEGMRQLKTA